MPVLLVSAHIIAALQAHGKSNYFWCGVNTCFILGISESDPNVLNVNSLLVNVFNVSLNEKKPLTDI